MFNIMCVLAFCSLFPALVFNYLLHYPLSVLLFTASLLILLAYFYYLSRFKKSFNISRIIFAVCCYGFVSLNFFYNSGINGPTLLAFFLTYIFLVAIFPRKTYVLWMVLHVVIAIVLLGINRYRPDLVPYAYASDMARGLDITATYVIMLVFSYFTLDFIRANYDFEKKSAADKAQEITRHNAILEKVNEEKNKLFSIVSHDLRSPLNTIHSYLELLSYGVLDEQEKTDAQNELVELTKNTSDLLYNLLSWSKTQMEGVNVRLQKNNLFQILASTINTQHAIAGKKEISFNNNVDKQAVAFCDEDMLQLVVRNLLNNAIKFTPSLGEITIATKQNANSVCLMVSDNGLGIPPEQHKEIFSLKISSTYGTKNEKGIGLGLVLCKEYIELQGGSIRFESESGRGTTFFISLPC